MALYTLRVLPFVSYLTLGRGLIKQTGNIFVLSRVAEGSRYILTIVTLH